MNDCWIVVLSAVFLLMVIIGGGVGVVSVIEALCDAFPERRTYNPDCDDPDDF